MSKAKQDQEHRCACTTASNRYSYRSYNCTRKGTVAENGKWWCKQHAPSAVAARDKACREKYDRKKAISNSKQKKQTCAENIVTAVMELLSVGIQLPDSLAEVAKQYVEAAETLDALTRETEL